MKPLYIGVDEIKALQALAAYAEAHTLSIDDLLDQRLNHRPAPGLIPEFCCMIPIGFKVVFTLQQVSTGEYARCLSMSAEDPDRVPNPAAVELVMRFLGFKSELSDCHIDFETIDGNQKAIRVGELITTKTLQS
jgi:hypothetical protein